MREFVAIGDTVIDTFIKLKEAEVSGTPDHPDYKLSFAFGDKIPYESAEVVPAVGNSANAAVAAARLGLSSALATNLGADQDGEDCMTALSVNGVDTSLVVKQNGKKTNNHYALWYKDDRTILIKHEDYEYKLPDLGEPKWVYLSSLGENTLGFHEEIANYLKAHPGVSLAFQPGTYQISLGKEKLKAIYERTTIFFCNIQEAEKILGINTLGTDELIKRMHDLGPKIVVLTDGPKGAYAYAGEEVIFQAPYPDPKPPYERTGAGDAFASTTVAALALGKDLKTALSWGAVNSMSVVQYVGAQKGLLSRKDIEEILRSASTPLQQQ